MDAAKIHLIGTESEQFEVRQAVADDAQAHSPSVLQYI